MFFRKSVPSNTESYCQCTGKRVTYSNKHNTQGQGISHHHLHHNKTHKYHWGHSASSVPSPKSSHTHRHIYMKKQSFPLPSHTHTHKQPSLIHTSNHTCKHSPPHTLMPWPPTAGWARPQFGWSPEFLTLGCECYLFCECCAVRGAWWEVGVASAGPLSRSTILTWQKRAYRNFRCFRLAFADTVCSCTLTQLTHKFSQARYLLSSMPFTIGTAVSLRCSGSLSFTMPAFKVTLAMTLKTSSRWGSDPCVPPSGVRWVKAGWRRGRLPKTAASL